MDPIVLFLKEDILPKEKSKVDKVRRKAPWFWLFEDQKLYKHLFLGHTCSTYILRHQNYSLRNYMKGFVEAILEVDLYLTKLSLKATGGQTCKKKKKNM